MTVTLNKPTSGTQNWDVPVNENWETIEAELNGLASEKANLSLSNLDSDGQALFTAKVNLDADNLSATAKERIRLLDVPNYAGAVAYGTSMTTPSSGYVQWQGSATNGTAYFYIGQVQVDIISLVGDRSAGGTLRSGLFKVPKGTSCSASNGTIYFYPNKEVTPS